MQVILAAILLISLGALLLYQFLAHSFDDGDAVDAGDAPEPAETLAPEDLKAA